MHSNHDSAAPLRPDSVKQWLGAHHDVSGAILT